MGVLDQSYSPLIIDTSLMKLSDYEECAPRMILNDIPKFRSRKSAEGVQVDVRTFVDRNIGHCVRYWVFSTIFDIGYHIWYWVVISGVSYLSLEYGRHNLGTRFKKATWLKRVSA